MQVSQKSLYALRAVFELAKRNNQGPIKTVEIAKAQAIPKRFLETILSQVEAGTGEGNQNEMTLHFGLGGHKDTVNLDIFWAGGLSQRVSKIKLNQRFTVKFDLHSMTK